MVQHAAGARATHGFVLLHPPAPRLEVDGKETQLAPAVRHRDVGPPPVEEAAASQRGEVRFTPVGDASAKSEPGREVTEKGLRTLPAGAIRVRHRAHRDLEVPFRRRKHAPRRRFVLHFLEGDDVGVERLHLPGDRRVVGLHPRNAAFEIRVFQMFEVPRGNPQCVRANGGGDNRQHQD